MIILRNTALLSKRGIIVKIYLFNTETGAYLGEVFRQAQQREDQRP
jgi:hypothetical protein